MEMKTMRMRVDGRQFEQGRKPQIVFGKIKGRCLVHLGHSRVFAKVNYDVTVPKSSTPAKGILRIRLGQVSCNAYGKEQEVHKSLERCIIDSKAVDLESLCIIPGLRVWAIEVEIVIRSYDGNLVGCASIAAISALAHCRVPQVKCVDNVVLVYAAFEKEPVALNFHFIPICITLALFDQSKCILVDPLAIEEKSCEKYYIVDVNASQGMCRVYHCDVLLNEDVQRSVMDIAIKHAQEVTHEIRAALDNSNFKSRDLDCLLSDLENVTI